METINLDAATERIVEMANGLIALIPSLVIAAVVLVVFIVLAGYVRRVVRSAADRGGLSDGAQRVFSRLARWAMVLVGLLVALTVVMPDLSGADLIGALGIGSVAVGFAFRDVLQNFLAGLLLLLQEPFKIGDQIVVGDFEGTVENIETRATTLRTYDNRRVVMPNSAIFVEAVLVNTAFPTRRSQYDVGIGYGEDIARAREVMLDAVRDVDGVLGDPPPDALTVELAGSSVNIRVRWWTDAGRSSVVAVSDRVVTAVKDALDDAGIEIPFPQRVVHFYDESADVEPGAAARNGADG